MNKFKARINEDRSEPLLRARIGNEDRRLPFENWLEAESDSLCLRSNLFVKNVRVAIFSALSY